MFAILATLCFLLATFGVSTLGIVVLVPLGLAFLALHTLVPYTPWTRSRP